jgi:CheY-like chemotaxis protein/HPt (histidine-containing phosphotransfer) domain-containing protein
MWVNCTENSIMQINSILVVEDNPSNQLLIKQQLTILGYDVELVESAEHALEVLVPDKFDILMTDINMPGIDGYELAYTIRTSNDEGVSKIPIIAITANATIEDEQKCLESGIDGFITKPVDIKYLQTFLQDLMINNDKRKYQAQNTGENPLLINDIKFSAIIDSELLDITDLSSFVGGNKAMVCKLLDTFSEQTPAIIADIKSACSCSQLDAVVRACHKLKSSARSIGAFRLSNLCIAMEAASRANQLDTVKALGAQIDSIITDTMTAIDQVKD